ncbi:MAG: EAL domain-containing protein [Trueperaceae bacterium]|nr:EAL domain-containing protein [Trueperaceae bacterium]
MNALDAVWDALPVGVLVVDAAGVVRHANPAAELLLGCTRGAVGTPLVDLVRPAEDDAAQAGDAPFLPDVDAVVARRAWRGVRTIRAAGGARTAVFVRLLALPGDADGRVLVTLHDADAEVRLRQLDDLFEGLDVGVAWSDASGTTLAGMNRAYAAMQGTTPEALLGTPILERFPHERRSLVQARFDEADRTGVTTYDTERVRPDGTTVPTWTTVQRLDPSTGLHARYLATVQDLRCVRATEAELESERLRTALATATTAVGFWSAPVGTTDVAVGDGWARTLGYGPDELPGGLATFERLVHPDDVERVTSKLRAFLRSPHGRYRAEYRLVRRDGGVTRVLSHATVEHDPDGRPVAVHGIDVDVSDLHDLSERVDTLTYTDPLTGLANRAGVQRAVERHLKLDPSRATGTAVVMVGIDGFRAVNDSLGHDAGDEALAQVATRLSTYAGLFEVVGRQADDRFALTLSSWGDLSDLDGELEEVHALFDAPLSLTGRSVPVDVSVGVAIAGTDGGDAGELLAHAEVALHAAKDAGGGRTAYYAVDLDRIAAERIAVRSDLARALADAHLRAVYQPQRHLTNGRISGFEALVRWRHPERGDVPPSRFVPEAERSGQIVALGRQVRRMALARWRAWSDAGLTPGRVSVNVSAREIEEPGWARGLLGDLRRAGVPPEGFEVEVTETSAMRAMEVARDALDAVRAAGVRVAIDDFGTGYASLAQLQRLPADRLKLDVSFVRRLDADGTDADREMVRAMVSLAHAFGLDAVAEGVETEAQEAFLREVDCDLVQGWRVARPLEADDVPAWLVADAGGTPDPGGGGPGGAPSADDGAPPAGPPS